MSQKDLLNKIKLLEEKINDNTKKSTYNTKQIKGIGQDVISFQEGVGASIVPYQRFVGYLLGMIFVIIGLIIIIVTAYKGYSDSDLKDHGYITGGCLIGMGILYAIIIYFWTGYVERSKQGKLINAVLFEKRLMK